MNNMEFTVEVYHSRELMDDDYYLPFKAVCTYEEMQKVMEFSLLRGYYVLVSVYEEEETK